MVDHSNSEPSHDANSLNVAAAAVALTLGPLGSMLQGVQHLPTTPG